MTTFTDLGATCQFCDKEYPDEPVPEEGTEYTCPCCQTIDTIEKLLEECQGRLDYDMNLKAVIAIRDNLTIVDNWLDDIAYLIKANS